ncbi:MAG: heme exporter protein CcmD [Pseudomonadota bacterium]|nr:heme exporter protein CcmD [Pseudomonadota bacterium]
MTSHAFYIWSAWGFTALVLGGLLACSILRLYRARKAQQP